VPRRCHLPAQVAAHRPERRRHRLPID
jgi:hypothetical protein